MSTPKTVLAALPGYVTLSVELAGELVPLAKGLISEIRQHTTAGKNAGYTVLVQTDANELDAVDKLSRDDLTAINAELQRLGLPAVPVPPPSGGEVSGS